MLWTDTLLALALALFFSVSFSHFWSNVELKAFRAIINSLHNCARTSICWCLLSSGIFLVPMFDHIRHAYRMDATIFSHCSHIHIMFIYGKQKERTIHCNLREKKKKYLHELLMCVSLHFSLSLSHSSYVWNCFGDITGNSTQCARVLRLRCTSSLPTIPHIFNGISILLFAVFCFAIINNEITWPHINSLNTKFRWLAAKQHTKEIRNLMQTSIFYLAAMDLQTLELWMNDRINWNVYWERN